MENNIADKLESFFSKFKHQSYKKSEILIRADDDPTGVYFLKEGRVKQYIISKNGEEVSVNIFKPISFFPMSWAVNDSRNIYYYEAMSDSAVWRAPKDKVIEFIKKEPEVLYDLLKRVYRGTDGILTRMAYLMSGSAYERLVTEILIWAKRFGQKTPKGIKLTVSEKDLAGQTGMTHETVSREIKILKEKKLVSFVKNVLTIHDIEKLEKELSTDF